MRVCVGGGEMTGEGGRKEENENWAVAPKWRRRGQQWGGRRLLSDSQHALFSHSYIYIVA